MNKLMLFNKPYGVLCQFSADGSDKPTLKEFIDVPDFYPAGRLDTDSEGLLLLTNDGKLQAQISDPKYKMPKTYWAQVEGVPDEAALMSLRNGIMMKDGMTRPADAKVLNEPTLWERNPPIRFRANIPSTWIELTIREGKNRQVRRMTAAVGFPTLRLVRVSIGQWHLADLAPGHWAWYSANANTAQEQR